jgi:putative hydrolase of the HAD superfamily
MWKGSKSRIPRFFQIVLERAGGRPETAVHVGDLFYVDVMGARNAGIRPLLLDPHGLYRDFDAPRIESLPELVSLVMEINHEDTKTRG